MVMITILGTSCVALEVCNVLSGTLLLLEKGCLDGKHLV